MSDTTGDDSSNAACSKILWKISLIFFMKPALVVMASPLASHTWTPQHNAAVFTYVSFIIPYYYVEFMSRLFIMQIFLNRAALNYRTLKLLLLQKISLDNGI